MRRQFGAVAVLSAAAAVLSLAGCGGSSTNPNGSSNSFKSLPAAEQQSFEAAAEEEVTATVSSFTSLNPLSGALFFDRVAPHRFNGAFRMMHSDRNAPRFGTASCSTNTGDLSDPDNDGVVNSDTTSANNCTFSGSGETITENGFFAIGDPTPNTQDLDIDDAGNLTLVATGSTGNVNLVLSGQDSVTEGTGVIQLSGNWNINESVTGNPQGYNGTFKLGANETATYTFSGTAPVTFGTLPEPGKFSLSGNWTYDINATNANYNLSFTVSTPTPLTIDGCSGNSEGIDSGEVDIKFTDGTVVAIKWSGFPATPSTTTS